MKNKLYSFVKENTWLNWDNHIVNIKRGWGNGYVVIPKGHPAHNINYDEIFVDVHGGLTFSNNVDSLNKEDFPELTNEMAGCWVVGFDTAHFGDNLENWTKERVIDETNDLRLQLGRMFLKSFIK
tara:strand:+ start:1266 stop:1640 length:375 start_codon:yes stop_codon:yes gene_type:complete